MLQFMCSRKNKKGKQTDLELAALSDPKDANEEDLDTAEEADESREAVDEEEIENLEEDNLELSVDEDNAWIFTQTSADTVSCMSADSPGYDKGGHGVVLADSTITTYLLPPILSMPIENARVKDPFVEHPFIPEEDDAHIKEAHNIRSLHTSALIHVKSASPLTNARTTCVHYLHSAKSPQSTLLSSDTEIHGDLTRNYHELSFIAHLRYGLKNDANLPFHLAALQTMQIALERGEMASE